MSKIYRFELAISTGEELKDVFSKHFSIYRKKFSYSPIYLVSGDKNVFEVGYFDTDSIVCTYKKSKVTKEDILINKNDEYIKIDNVESVPDFLMGIYSLVQDVHKMRE